MRFLKVLICIVFAATLAFTVYVRTSKTKDYSGPKITCDTDSISVSVNDGDPELLKHVTAFDEQDGDITSSVVVESISPFVAGSRANVTFAVCDKDNNVAKLTKEIVYTDYSAPEFTIKKQQVYYVGAAKVNLLDGVYAEDILDGDISSRITVTDSEIDLSEPGVYPITYRVTTSMGTVSELRANVYVYESRLKESITLTDYLVYTQKGQQITPNSFVEYYPEEYLDSGYYDDYNYELRIVDEADYEKSGTYTVTYRFIKTPKRTRYNETVKEEILAEAYLTVVVR